MKKVISTENLKELAIDCENIKDEGNLKGKVVESGFGSPRLNESFFHKKTNCEIFARKVTVGSAKQVLEQVERLDGLVVTYVDIDDTVIVPQSKTFREAPYNKMISEIKANKQLYSNYEEIISNWRLQRKIELLDKDWPEVLNGLKKKGSVYALTQVDVGKIGNIESMEKWRYEEMQKLGIEFTEDFEFEGQEDQKESVFYKGMFLTGSSTKAETLSKHGVKAQTVLMIDDRQEHIEDIEKFCRQYGINFLGILFERLKRLGEKANPEISEIQKKWLINTAQWLEDEEVTKMLKDK